MSIFLVSTITLKLILKYFLQKLSVLHLQTHNMYVISIYFYGRALGFLLNHSIYKEAWKLKTFAQLREIKCQPNERIWLLKDTCRKHYRKMRNCWLPAFFLLPTLNALKGLHPKGFLRPANGFVTEEKRTKHAEFGYPVTKFISLDARDSSDRFVESISHIMTIHQTDVSVRFVRWKVLNMLKT